MYETVTLQHVRSHLVFASVLSPRSGGVNSIALRQ